VRRLLLAAALLAGAALPARAEDDGTGSVGGDVVDAERPASLALLRATVVLASTTGEDPPADDAVEALGTLIGADGLVVTTWDWLAGRAAIFPMPTLWARSVGAPWERAVGVARTWYADVGLVRVLTRRRDLRPLEMPTDPAAGAGFGRALVVGPGSDARPTVRALLPSTIEWFDPATVGGRKVQRRGMDARPGPKGSWPVMLRLEDDAALRVTPGAPVVDGKGAWIGFVVDRDPSGPRTSAIAVRPVAALRPWIERLRSDGCFDPGDLGVSFAPNPGREPTPAPKDLEALRAASGKEPVGAVIDTVDLRGPAAGVLWPGDVVTTVAGVALAGEVYESVGRALLALRAGEPTDVTVLRGGKRATVSVTPRPSRNADRDAAGEHDRRGKALRTPAR